MKEKIQVNEKFKFSVENINKMKKETAGKSKKQSGSIKRCTEKGKNREKE